MEVRTASVLVTAYGGSASPAGSYTPVSVPAEPWGEAIRPKEGFATKAELYAFIRRNPQMSVGELAKATGIRRGSVTRFRKRMYMDRKARLDRNVEGEAFADLLGEEAGQ